jgi:hypothetical protein
MYDSSSNLISRLLRDSVAYVDIPPDLRAAAAAEYRRVGDWLAAHADGDAGWVVYPQGSFLLNTVVLPAARDHYDIDTVCRREIDKHATTQAKLKREVGGALCSYVAVHRHLPDGPVGCGERNRCWTLRYRAQLRFHLDVLPGIPNPEAPPDGILITDRELREWQRSNPLAFAAWFRRQAEGEFIAERVRLAEAKHIPPQEIPDWEVKTTLQWVVQVIKLHRNHHFRDDLGSRPASILVTTLAAHAYNGEQADLYQTLLQTVARMPGHISQGHDGLWVPNPVEPRENFADRWRDRPDLARKFCGWLERLSEDLRAAGSHRGLDKVAGHLQESLGVEPVQGAVARLGESYRRTRENGALRLAPATGVLSTGAGVRIRDHGFYGGSHRR